MQRHSPMERMSASAGRRHAGLCLSQWRSLLPVVHGYTRARCSTSPHHYPRLRARRGDGAWRRRLLDLLRRSLRNPNGKEPVKMTYSRGKRHIIGSLCTWDGYDMKEFREVYCPAGWITRHATRQQWIQRYYTRRSSTANNQSDPSSAIGR